MKVEIWSDVVCPFCYIGKRKFEKALDSFLGKENVEIIWKSFQLDPDCQPVPGQSVHEYLGKRKGTTAAEGKKMNDYMTEVASEVGLNYDFDKAITANTMLAHRLIHLAKDKDLQDAMKERLLAAYYTQGKDIGDVNTLVQLAGEVGLDETEVREVLLTDKYTQEVEQDIYEAQQVGVRGVPFFVFNRKYAVSGAQPPELFTDVLEKVWQEEKPLMMQNATGGTCTPDGVCD